MISSIRVLIEIGYRSSASASPSWTSSHVSIGYLHFMASPSRAGPGMSEVPGALGGGRGELRDHPLAEQLDGPHDLVVRQSADRVGGDDLVDVLGGEAFDDVDGIVGVADADHAEFDERVDHVAVLL